MERETLINTAFDTKAVTRMKSMIQAPTRGIISSSLNPAIEEWIPRSLGTFGNKVVGVSDGAELLDVSNITALGGWCAIRSNDFKRLNDSGTVFDPDTGVETKIKEVEAIADWITRAVSIDQVVDAIGMFQGKRYVAISEEKLWSERTINTVEEQLKRPLTSSEKDTISNAVAVAEQLRYQYTNRYLKYATGEDATLTRVVDQDIFSELKEVRDQMLEVAELPLQEFKQRFPDGRSESYSIVWGMYTGPYLDLLKKKGYVADQKAIILEPWWHAFNENNPAKTEVNERVFSRNPYLASEGINKNIGYVAYADAMDNVSDRYRNIYPISAVPNRENYQKFITELSQDPKLVTLDLRNNPAFSWGVNLVPFGKAIIYLNTMVAIKDQWKEEKANINNAQRSKQDRIAMTAELKTQYQKIIADQAALVVNEVSEMLNYVFGERTYGTE